MFIYLLIVLWNQAEHDPLMDTQPSFTPSKSVLVSKLTAFTEDDDKEEVERAFRQSTAAHEALSLNMDESTRVSMFK